MPDAATDIRPLLLMCDIHPLFKAHRISTLTRFDAENEQTIRCCDGHPSVVLSCVIFIHYSRLIVLEHLQDLIQRMSDLLPTSTFTNKCWKLYS